MARILIAELRWGAIGAAFKEDCREVVSRQVDIDGGWHIGRVLERPGITTQARTLDGRVDMLRDAI